MDASYSTTKMFSVLDSNNLVIDCWLAKTKEEAEQDNPGKTVIEMTTENSPAYFGSYWNGKKFILRSNNG